ncbi:A24 family peptidase, partial [Nocardioides aquaticus]|uniref:A24 family peptidase n=1 Tax=Nocardioides aquaticus TaxID=160826 RepID=UPI0031D9184F
AAPGLARRTAVVGALAARLVAWSVGAEPALVGLVAVVPVAVALGAVDLRTRLLPKVLVLPATAWLVAVAAVAALLGGPAETDALVRSLVALVAARTAYWLLWFVRSAGLGFGDVRLAAMVGAGLGQLGWAEVLVGLYAGFLVFGVPGALWALVRRDRSLLRAAYPFGPFLLLGALLGVLLGDVVAGALGWA